VVGTLMRQTVAHPMSNPRSPSRNFWSPIPRAFGKDNSLSEHALTVPEPALCCLETRERILNFDVPHLCNRALLVPLRGCELVA
jgi:hypothetical protein